MCLDSAFRRTNENLPVLPSQVRILSGAADYAFLLAIAGAAIAGLWVAFVI
jgi:hypothetical protein